jgi:hypothetical protein
MGVKFERPIGPLQAELKALATDIANQTAKVLPTDNASALALFTTKYIDECHGLSKWGDNWFLRLISGWVEQGIVVVCVFSVLLFAYELILVCFDRSTMLFAINAAEQIVELIPYIGFFGTILGMSLALWILGDIDISDTLQKATKIGPITGNISLAMEATQLGLIFFLFASFLIRLLRIIFEDAPRLSASARTQNGAEQEPVAVPTPSRVLASPAPTKGD